VDIKKEFLDRVKYYKGVPFHHQGRNRQLGLDCAGLIVVALEDIGYPVKDLEAYDRLPHPGRLKAIVNLNQAKKIPKEIMGPGDILLMRFAKDPQHLAVYAGDTIIHSYQKQGCVVEQRFSDLWDKRILEVFSLV